MIAAKPTVETLRAAYPEFRFRSYAMEIRLDNVQATFCFGAVSRDRANFPDLNYRATLTFREVPDAARFQADRSATGAFLFHIGLAEMLSYWKATCSPRILIDAGFLSSHQIAWWTDLLLNGMGEYFFVNGIDASGEDFVRLESTVERSGAAIERREAGTPPATVCRPNSYLVPVGGGRDSAVAAEALRRSGLDFQCMTLKTIPAALRVSRIARPGAEPILVERAIDPELLRLNSLGFLNGHVPFSAHLGLVASFCLYLYNLGAIVVANERSADEGNAIFHGREINHQYSKSLRFEEQLDEYLQRYLLTGGRYVSFVRSLYELQIGQLFSALPEYHAIFRSCNRNQKQDSWCGECSKCISVYITTYPFLGRERTARIFGRDLYETASIIPMLRELSGLDAMKPFDCVCTKAEAVAGLYLSFERAKADGLPTPPALEYAAQRIIPGDGSARDIAARLLASRGHDRLPAPLRQALDQLRSG